MTRTAAIRAARRRVNRPYRMGYGWQYTYRDDQCDAWRVVEHLSTYWTATRSYTTRLLDIALGAMGIADAAREAIMDAYHDDPTPGRWTAWVPSTTEASNTTPNEE